MSERPVEVAGLLRSGWMSGWSIARRPERTSDFGAPRISSIRDCLDLCKDSTGSEEDDRTDLEYSVCLDGHIFGGAELLQNVFTLGGRISPEPGPCLATDSAEGNNLFSGKNLRLLGGIDLRGGSSHTRSSSGTIPLKH